MKKSLIFSKSVVFGLLLALSLSWELSAQSVTAGTGKLNMYLLTNQSKQRMEMNLFNSSNNITIPPLEYTMILAQQNQNYNQPSNEAIDSKNKDSELMILLYSQLTNLQQLENQWQMLKSRLERLSNFNTELLNTLEEQKTTIALLRRNLQIALERIQDAEEGALALLDENAEIFKQAKNTAARITMLERQVGKSKKSVIIGFTVGGVSFGVGTPLIIEGIRTDNSTMLWSGVGTVGAGALVWSLGHYVFEWW